MEFVEDISSCSYYVLKIFVCVKIELKYLYTLKSNGDFNVVFDFLI